jgi:hypothetical protein
MALSNRSITVIVGRAEKQIKYHVVQYDAIFKYIIGIKGGSNQLSG